MVEYAIGKITPYGPVCNACAHHFREKEPCEGCGQLSSRLTRVSRLGSGSRLCPRCSRADYGTCRACRRYRLLLEGPDGRHLCRRCSDGVMVPCSSCGCLMPAGRGKACETCYWKEVRCKRTEIDAAAFSVPDMAEAFKEFGQWLENAVGPHRASLTVHRYLPFFMAMDGTWGRIPRYLDLLGQFGAEGLRRVRLPMRWLGESRGVRVDPKAREADSERRRIAALLDLMPRGSGSHEILTKYATVLRSAANSGRRSLRTVRLALKPASALLMVAAANARTTPNQSDLDQYLLLVPGQRAAVTGFIHFLSGAYNVRLMVHTAPVRTSGNRKRVLQQQIVRMARHPEDGDGFEKRWASLCLRYFHLLQIAPRNLRAEDVSVTAGGMQVAVEGRAYFVPHWDSWSSNGSATHAWWQP